MQRLSLSKPVTFLHSSGVTGGNAVHCVIRSFFSGQNFFTLKNMERNRRCLAGNGRRLVGNRQWLVGNRQRLQGNHLDIWVASDIKKKSGETAVVKMSKTGDVRTYGLHQIKDKEFLVEWP